MSAMADPASFCTSPCYTTLRPCVAVTFLPRFHHVSSRLLYILSRFHHIRRWVDACFAGLDAGVQAVFAPALSLMAACPPPADTSMDNGSFLISRVFVCASCAVRGIVSHFCSRLLDRCALLSDLPGWMRRVLLSNWRFWRRWDCRRVPRCPGKFHTDPSHAEAPGCF